MEKFFGWQAFVKLIPFALAFFAGMRRDLPGFRLIRENLGLIEQAKLIRQHRLFTGRTEPPVLGKAKLLKIPIVEYF